MARLFFVAVLCIVARLACQEARADDPIVAEITALEDQLFYLPESDDRSAQLSANQTLERLIRLESLAVQRTEQYWQLVTDVRELISFSQITDEKCRAGEFIGVMLGNFDAYYDISHTIRAYWAQQATRQLEHCLLKLNEALARHRAIGQFMRSIEIVHDAARLPTLLDDGYIQGTLACLNAGDGGSLPKSEAKFAARWDEYIQKPCDGITEAIEPWIGIFDAHKSVYLNGIRLENEELERVKFINWGAQYCRRVSTLKDNIFRLYMPQGVKGILNQALLRDYQGLKTALYEAVNGNKDK